MIADSSMLATWREDDPFDPVALIQRGLQLARKLEINPPQARKPRARARVAVDVPASKIHLNQDTPGQTDPRSGPQTQLQTLTQTVPVHQPETVSDRFALDWAKLWWQRGQHKLQQGDYQGARENFSKALQKWPQMAAAHNGLGIVFYHGGDFNSAIAAYRRALHYAPHEAHIHTNLAGALHQVGNWVVAIATYRHALHLDPHQVVAYYGLGVSFFQLGRYSEALTAYEQAIQFQPNHAGSYAGLGRLLVELGDREGAITAYRRAMQLNPEYSQAYLNLQLQAL